MSESLNKEMFKSLDYIKKNYDLNLKRADFIRIAINHLNKHIKADNEKLINKVLKENKYL